MENKKWIQDAIKHKGALRKEAKKEHLIKGNEKLSMTDLSKLEKKGGKTAKRAYLAATLRGFGDGGELDTFSEIFKTFGFSERRSSYGLKKFYKNHDGISYYGTVDSGGYNRPVLLEKFETAGKGNDYRYGQVLYEGLSVKALIQKLKDLGFEEKMANGGDIDDDDILVFLERKEPEEESEEPDYDDFAKGGVTKYDEGSFSGYKMIEGGKDWFIIRHKSYDTGKVYWNVYVNSVDGENWIDGFMKKSDAIYHIKNEYTNYDKMASGIVVKKSSLLPKMAKGGKVKRAFLDTMNHLHQEIDEIKLKDGTKITHADLAKANNVMADGGEIDEKIGLLRNQKEKLREEYNNAQMEGKNTNKILAKIQTVNDELNSALKEKWAAKLADGGMTFEGKVQRIAKKLEGKPVPKPYRKEYGTRYDKEDAMEAAQRIVGNMTKMERKKQE